MAPNKNGKSARKIGTLPLVQILAASLAIIVACIVAGLGPSQRVALIHVGSTSEGSSAKLFEDKLKELSGNGHIIWALFVTVIPGDASPQRFSQGKLDVEWRSASQIHQIYRPSLDVALETASQAFDDLGKPRLFLERILGISSRVVIVVDEKPEVSSQALAESAERLARMNVVVDVVTEGELGKASENANSLELEADPLNAAESLSKSKAKVKIRGYSEAGRHQYRCALDGEQFHASGTGSVVDGTDYFEIPFSEFTPGTGLTNSLLPYGFHRIECQVGNGSARSVAVGYVQARFLNIHLVQGPTKTLSPEDAEHLSDQRYHDLEYLDDKTHRDDPRFRPRLVVLDGVSLNFWLRAEGELHDLVNRGGQLYVSGPPPNSPEFLLNYGWLPGFALMGPQGESWRHEVGRSVHFLDDISSLGDIDFRPASGQIETCSGLTCDAVPKGTEIQKKVIQIVSQETGSMPEVTNPPVASSPTTVERLRQGSVNRRLKEVLRNDFSATPTSRVGELLVIFAYDLPQIDSDFSAWIEIQKQGRQILLVALQNQMTEYLSKDPALTIPLKEWYASAQAESEKQLMGASALPLLPNEIIKATNMASVSVLGKKADGVAAEIDALIGQNLDQGVGRDRSSIQSLLSGRLGPPLEPRESPRTVQFVIPIIQPNAKWSVGIYDKWFPGSTNTYLSDKALTVGNIAGRASVIVSGEPLTGRGLARLLAFVEASKLLDLAPPIVELSEIRHSANNDLVLEARYPDLSGRNGVSEQLLVVKCENDWQEPLCQTSSDITGKSATLTGVNIQRRSAKFLLDSSVAGDLCHGASSCVLALKQNRAVRFLWTSSPLGPPQPSDKALPKALEQLPMTTGGRSVLDLKELNRLDSRRIDKLTTALMAILLAGIISRGLMQLVRMRKNATPDSRRPSFDITSNPVVAPIGPAEVDRCPGSLAGTKPLEPGDSLQNLSVPTLLAWGHGLKVTPNLYVYENVFRTPLQLDVRLFERGVRLKDQKVSTAIYVVGLVCTHALKCGRTVWVTMQGIKGIQLSRFTGEEDLRRSLENLFSGKKVIGESEIPEDLRADFILVSDFLGGSEKTEEWLRSQERSGNRFLGATCIVDPEDWQGGAYVRNRHIILDRSGWSRSDEVLFRRVHERDSGQLVHTRGGVMVVIDTSETWVSWVRALVSRGFLEMVST